MPLPVPLFVVEDQAQVLKALLKLVSTWPEVKVVGTAMSGEAALGELGPSGARVALLDIELPGIDGLELVARLKSANVGCELLMLTSFVDDERLFQAMHRGAAGYLVKGTPADRLKAAILEVDAGGTVIEPRLARHFWRYFKGMEAPARPEAPLDAEELQLLELMARGLSNAEAAGAMGWATRSLRTRLQKVYDKLGVRSHVEAVVEALRRGWIRL
jgi:DNA-binding NarL/FixJ family response regulator